MNTGKIDKNGVDNIRAIATLIEQQIVEYDFQYYKSELPTNVSCVVLGNGRSMFKNTIQMPAKGGNNLTEDDLKKVESVLKD